MQKILVTLLVGTACFHTAKAANDPIIIAEDGWETVPFYQEDSKIRELSTDLASIFFWDLDIEQKLVNLADGGGRLVFDDESKGFRFFENWNFALWAPPSWHTSIPTVMPIWINPIIGAGISSGRFVKSRSEVPKLPHIGFPTQTKDLQTWAVGDFVQYRMTGGVGFTAGWDVGGVYMGPYFVAQGDWLYYVEKTDEQKVYVKVTNASMRSLGASVGTSFVSVGVELFNHTDLGFSYSYDLKDPQAAQAYEDAIHGNLIPTDQRVAAVRGGSVQKKYGSRRAALGYLRYWYFGLPFVGSAGGQNGKIYSISDERIHSDESKSQIEYAAYFNETQTNGLISSHLRFLNDFYGVYYTNTTRDGKVTPGYWGQFLWGYENMRTSSSDFKQALRQLARQTGLGPELRIDIPQKNLGYLNVRLLANLGEMATDALVGAVRTDENRITTQLESAIREGVAKYFSDGKDAEHICLFEDRQWESVDHCIGRLNRSHTVVVGEMVHHLKNMEQSKSKSKAQFVHSYAEFGKRMIQNRFIFQAVRKILKETPIEIVLTLEGDRVAKFHRELTHCFSKG